MKAVALLIVVSSVVACTERSQSGVAAEPGGTLVISTTVDPGSLFPPHGVTIQAKQITEQIYDYLADVGPEMDIRDETKFRPELADRWRWSSDSLILAFHINPRAKWHDGRDVTARDVQFTFQLNKNPALASRFASELGRIDSVSITDSLTPVFWFRERYPRQFLDAAAQLLILPAHQLEKIPVDSLRESTPSPIGTGRFRLRKRDRGVAIEIVADTSNYRGRGKLDRVIWSIAPEFPVAVARLMGGEADLFDALRPENQRELTRHATLTTLNLPGMDLGFVRFNLRDPANKTKAHPLFGDRNLRRAIAMSVNRQTLVRSVLDTFALVPVGPVVRTFAATDPRGSQLPFDSVHASALLDSLGWIRAGQDGMRARQGRELAFTLSMPTSSLTRVRMGPLIQEQLRRMGIGVRLEILEGSTFTDRESQGKFDATLGSFVFATSLDALKSCWTTAAIGRNGVNYGSYSNPRFDALLDSALAASPAEAREKFTAAYAVINEDAPGVWLYEPRKIIGFHRRFRTAPPRPDAWWFSLADWSIPPSERILRDRLPPHR